MGVEDSMDMLVEMLPNILFLLLVASLWLITLAIVSPGTGVYEVLATMTLLGVGAGMFYALLNLWALIPIAMGFALFFFALRAKTRHSVWLLGSALCFSGGSIFLFRHEEGIVAVNPLLAVLATAFTLVFYWFAVRSVIAAQKLDSRFDPEHVLGAIGEARTDLDLDGTVFVGGELWSASAEQPIRDGSKVRVCAREGLVLKVMEAEMETKESSGG
jgi:membrane-bound serine protease (ClpP class)